MKKYFAGEEVQRGVYINLTTWEVIQLHKEPLVLPGEKPVQYLKAPAPIMVTLGPLAGLAFVIFLPLAGIIGLAGFVSYKLGRATRAMVRGTVQPVAIAWNPGIAHLTKHGRKGDGKEAAKDLIDLEREIKDLRDEQEQ